MKIDASLAAVDQLLKRTIESESIVNDLYRHVFQVSGKKLRAKLDHKKKYFVEYKNKKNNFVSTITTGKEPK